jgi:hypothetical protein
MYSDDDEVMMILVRGVATHPLTILNILASPPATNPDSRSTRTPDQRSFLGQTDGQTNGRERTGKKKFRVYLFFIFFSDEAFLRVTVAKPHDPNRALNPFRRGARSIPQRRGFEA